MTEPGSSPDEPAAEAPPTPLGYLMRRILGPAAAIVILYASIVALPPLLMNQLPPVTGADLLRVFIASLFVFALLAVFLDWKAKGGSRHEE